MSENVCAFADSERHFSHILKIESERVAFDGTHLGGREQLGFSGCRHFP
jgi:hypothetical protein